jgi:hypothetical protein
MEDCRDRGWNVRLFLLEVECQIPSTVSEEVVSATAYVWEIKED